MCDSKDLLVGYLYDELETSERRAFEAHLLSCGECRDELGGLRATRGQIAAWTPPAADLGFRIVRTEPVPIAPRRRFAPGWALAAAAVLVLAAGAAMANLEVRVARDGLTVRTGWNRPAAASQVADAAIRETEAVTLVEWKQQADLLDRRLRELERAPALRPQAAAAQTAPAARVSDAEVLRRVRAIIAESETRQQRELALRVRQVIQDFDARRRTDLATIQQGFGQIQGATAIEAQQHRDVMNYLRLVAQQK